MLNYSYICGNGDHKITNHSRAFHAIEKENAMNGTLKRMKVKGCSVCRHLD